MKLVLKGNNREVKKGSKITNKYGQKIYILEIDTTLSYIPYISYELPNGYVSYLEGIEVEKINAKWVPDEFLPVPKIEIQKDGKTYKGVYNRKKRIWKFGPILYSSDLILKMAKCFFNYADEKDVITEIKLGEISFTSKMVEDMRLIEEKPWLFK